MKMSLIVFGALAVSFLLRRRSAALRHWVLAAGVACAAGPGSHRRCAGVAAAVCGTHSVQSIRGSFPGIGVACITAVARGSYPFCPGGAESRATPMRGPDCGLTCGPPGSQERLLASRSC